MPIEVNDRNVWRITHKLNRLIGEELAEEQVDEVAKALAVMAYNAVTDCGEGLDEMTRLRLIVELQAYSLECGKQGLEILRQRNNLRHGEVEGRT